MPDGLVLIGGASGAWGDSPRAIGQLLREPVEYLIMDYLAEVSMSLLARARLKDPNGGYPPDFIAYLKPHLAEISARGVKIVSNAGGVNPSGCARALARVCADLGLSPRIAVVEGDDLMPMIDALRAEGVKEAVSGAPLPARMLTANAYLGALPIKTAFDLGADIVITGRCADSALALGALMHEFGWADDAHDLLAAGSLVGHMLECGAQGVGGLHTDWRRVPDWANIGYPLAECRADGQFVLTKPSDTGGLVTPGSAAEQALYEIGDPAAYILPDVIADFSQVTMTQVGPDRVLIRGARGTAPTPRYKVSATYQDGYRAVATVSIVGPDAAAKAERTGEALIARARIAFAEAGLPDFTQTHIEALGAEAAYGPHTTARQSREVLLRLVVTHKDPAALDLFARELGSVGISFAPGTTGIYNGRPKPAPQIRLFTFFIEKSRLAAPTVTLEGESISITIAEGVEPQPPAEEAMNPAPAMIVPADWIAVPLIRIALARSGDKGDSANIAIIARDPAFLPIIRDQVTPAAMAAHFSGLVVGPIQRFDAPGLDAVNFLMQGALGGGGMASLRIDPQGKAFGQMALEMMVKVPPGLLRDAPTPEAAHSA